MPPSSPSLARRLGLTLGAAAATLALLAGADRLLGLVVPQAWMARSLVFPPNVKFEMKTPEFQTGGIGRGELATIRQCAIAFARC